MTLPPDIQTIIVIAAVVLFAALLVSLVVNCVLASMAALTAGQNALLKKFVLEQKRVNMRQTAELRSELRLWQSKFTQSRGLGALDGTRNRDSAATPTRSSQVVSASQVVQELAARQPTIHSRPVPPSVKRGFLEEARRVGTENITQ